MLSLLPRSAVLNVSTLKIGPRSRHTVANKLTPTIQSFGHQHYSSLGKEELDAACESVFNQMKISQEAQYLSQASCLQSQSLLWFEHRKGRITASQFGAICRTSIQSPSQSLLNRILQITPMVNAAALDWGISKEVQQSQHTSMLFKQTTPHAFVVKSTGLRLNPDYPHLGASPNGLVSCFCCGYGLLETKCPYSKRHLDPTKIVDASFYLKPTSTGLRLSHSYMPTRILQFRMLHTHGDTHRENTTGPLLL